MAYQTRGRNPLFDSNMQAAIEKRGRELAGLALLAVALLTAAILGSYAAEDPSWMSASDAPVKNWLGPFGASVAAPVMMIVGLSGWGLAIVAGVWGARLALHVSDERAVGRLIFAPVWVALLSVYCASLVPGPGWAHTFGLGGLFGDTILGALMGLLPFATMAALKVVSLLLGAGVLALGLYVTGFTAQELSRLGRGLLIGLVLAYAALLKLLGHGATGAARAAGAVQSHARDRVATRREARLTANDSQIWRDDEEDEDEVLEQPRPSLFARLPAIVKRSDPDPMPEHELIQREPLDPDVEMPSDDRIKAKIADIVRSRAHTVPALRNEATPLTRGRGRRPDPLILARAGRAEPPVTAAAAAVRVEPPITTRAAPRVVAEPPVTARLATPAAVEPAVSRAIAPAAPRVPEPERRNPTPPERIEEPEADDDDWMLAEDDEAYPFAEDVPEPVSAANQFKLPSAEPRRVVQHPVKRETKPSARAQAEAQPGLSFDEASEAYELPPLSLLTNPANITRHHLSDDALEQNARMLEHVLDDYGVKGEIVAVRPGPVVTMYELEPAPGLKASRVIGLADDIARSMSALSARVSTVPGRSVIGIELPNDNREMVVLREILSAREYGDSHMKLPLALGKDIGGEPMVANLAKMPHLLIAGTTGSGKSVAINTMILSLLYRLTPEECRLIMIDPKMLELSVYDGIPHLLSPVVTDPKKAVVALKWVVGEMEERYRKMSKMGVRNIDGFNGRVQDALDKGEMFHRTVQTGFDEDTGEPIFETEDIQPEKMPYIVVIVDEMADLMMVAGKEIEACIQRLAQMARASGIHLIMATQRPSVDVITGTIKANFPTRISFQVTSKIDSRTILGEMGAEQLLGMGDMLYMAGGARITRCHAPFVSDEEVEEIVNYLKGFGPPDYVGNVVDGPDDEKADDIDAVLGLGGNTGGEDALYDQAVAIVIKDRKCSTSYIQRKLAIGYNKAARLVEQMEDEGVVSSANHVGKREVLVPEQQ